MTKRERDQDFHEPHEPHDPLLARLRALPSARLDDVNSSRTLARAESVLLAVGPRAATTGAPVASSSPLPGWLLSAALVGWGMLYVWGAVDALARLFPMRPRAGVTLAALPAQAGRGPVTDSLVVRAQ